MAEVLRGVHSLLFPTACTGCGIPVESPPSPPLCSACLIQLPRSLPPWCRRCGCSLCGLGVGAEECVRCRTHPPSFDQAVSGHPYEGTLKQLVLELKYEKRLSHAPFLAGLLCETVESRLVLPLDAVLPVPLHPTRRRERTFNQAECLGQILANRLGLPMWTDLLIRTQPTGPQSELNRQERSKNVQGAFSLREDRDVQGLRFLLVDDLFTTGATAQACSRQLKMRGAAQVFVATVTHG